VQPPIREREHEMAENGGGERADDEAGGERQCGARLRQGVGEQENARGHHQDGDAIR
jgi:hypothetical protein